MHYETSSRGTTASIRLLEEGGTPFPVNSAIIEGVKFCHNTEYEYLFAT